MLDEDGYAEIRWYTNPAALAEDITAAITAIPGPGTSTPARPGTSRLAR
jgi:hypothetical protein